MIKINWGNKQPTKKLYYGDLDRNTAFRIVSPFSKGAVYIKVLNVEEVFDRIKVNEYAYEVATGNLWEPTKSEVEIVHLAINIDAERPEIYDGI